MDLEAGRRTVDWMAETEDRQPTDDGQPDPLLLEWVYALGPVVALTLVALLTADDRRSSEIGPTVALVVLPLAALSSAACTTCSLSESSALVASSSNSTLGSRISARAIAMRCF